LCISHRDNRNAYMERLVELRMRKLRLREDMHLSLIGQTGPGAVRQVGGPVRPVGGPVRPV